MSEEYSNARKGPIHLTASTPLRLAAFMMDYILLYFSLLLVGNLFGNFQKNLQQFVEMSMDPQTDQASLEIFIQQSEIYENLFLFFLYFIIHLALPITYFYVSEKFFEGRSLGKATFSLKTSNAETTEPCTQSQIFTRSLLKGLSCSITPLGLFSLFLLIFKIGKL
jgi:uncharacterized RDD family membrane protein YckC